MTSLPNGHNSQFFIKIFKILQDLACRKKEKKKEKKNLSPVEEDALTSRENASAFTPPTNGHFLHRL